MVKNYKLVRVLVPLGDGGKVIGENHHRSKLTDKQVDLMIELHEDWGFGYRKLAWIFGVTKAQVRNICTYRQRGRAIMGHKVKYVRVEEEG